MNKRILFVLSGLPLFALAACGHISVSSSEASLSNSEAASSSAAVSSDVTVSSDANSSSSSVASSTESSQGTSSKSGSSSAASSSSSSASSSSSSSSTSSSSSSSVSSIPPVVGAIQILESSGLFESAYCTWSSLDGAVGYNVYEQKVGDSAWTKIDTELIRKYPSYWRADALGLPAGCSLHQHLPSRDRCARHQARSRGDHA